MREMFRIVWEREGWPMGEMGYEDWERLNQIIHQKINAHDFPGRIRARRKGGVLQVEILGPIG